MKHLEVSRNEGTPKSSIDGCCIINHLFLGFPIYGNLHLTFGIVWAKTWGYLWWWLMLLGSCDEIMKSYLDLTHATDLLCDQPWDFARLAVLFHETVSCLGGFATQSKILASCLIVSLNRVYRHILSKCFPCTRVRTASWGYACLAKTKHQNLCVISLTG